MTSIFIVLPDLIKIIGDFLIVISIYKVHSKLSEEKTIDQVVIYEVHHEKKLVLLGLLLVFVGFALDSYFKLSGTFLL
jgi:hypothetical protein